MRVIILLACNDHLLTRERFQTQKISPFFQACLWIPQMCFWGTLHCFASHYCYSSVLLSWTPGYLLMLHISSIPGWAPSLVVTAGTSITPVLPILCNTFSSFSSGLTEHPSHQRFMIFHRRDKKSLSFLSCCSVASWVTKAESLDYSIFPNLISVQHAYLQSSLLKGLSVRPQG